jgi:hypothetical protein
MLVREEPGQLHLLSVVSPEWIGKGKSISVSQAPTNFGPIAFTLDQPSDQEAVLHLTPAFTAAPRQIVVHLPWFVALQSATADGKVIQPTNGALAISPATRELRLRWTVKPASPRLNYSSAVDDYKAEYARRYQILMHGQPAAQN